MRLLDPRVIERGSREEMAALHGRLDDFYAGLFFKRLFGGPATCEDYPGVERSKEPARPFDVNRAMLEVWAARSVADICRSSPLPMAVRRRA